MEFTTQEEKDKAIVEAKDVVNGLEESLSKAKDTLTETEAGIVLE